MVIFDKRLSVNATEKNSTRGKTITVDLISEKSSSLLTDESMVENKAENKMQITFPVQSGPKKSRLSFLSKTRQIFLRQKTNAVLEAENEELHKRQAKAHKVETDNHIKLLMKEATKVTPSKLNFYDDIFNWKQNNGIRIV